MAGEIGTKRAPDHLSSDSPAPSLPQALMPEQHQTIDTMGTRPGSYLAAWLQTQEDFGRVRNRTGAEGAERRRRAAPKGGRAAHPVPHRPCPRVLGGRCPAGGSRAPRSARPPARPGPQAPPGLAWPSGPGQPLSRTGTAELCSCRGPAAEHSAGTWHPRRGLPAPRSLGALWVTPPHPP